MLQLTSGLPFLQCPDPSTFSSTVVNAAPWNGSLVGAAAARGTVAMKTRRNSAIPAQSRPPLDEADRARFAHEDIDTTTPRLVAQRPTNETNLFTGYAKQNHARRAGAFSRFAPLSIYALALWPAQRNRSSPHFWQLCCLPTDADERGSCPPGTRSMAVRLARAERALQRLSYVSQTTIESRSGNRWVESPVPQNDWEAPGSSSGDSGPRFRIRTTSSARPRLSGTVTPKPMVSLTRAHARLPPQARVSTNSSTGCLRGRW